MACAYVAKMAFEREFVGECGAACDEQGFFGDVVCNGDCKMFGSSDLGIVAMPRVCGVEKVNACRLKGHVNFANLATNFGEGGNGFAKGCGHAFEGILDDGVARGNGRSQIDGGEHHGEPR